MAAFQLQPAELPADFAVFPLSGALLLPGGRLPLNIFERRYLAMTDDCLCAGRLFGMVQPDETRPADNSGPALFRVGCLGRLSSFSETDDGRYLVTLTGVIRFAIAEELAMGRGYRRVRGDFRPYLRDLDLGVQSTGVERDVLIGALRRFFHSHGFDANWDAIEQMPDDMLVVTLCMVCPFEPVEKQALLEAATDEDRARTLVTLLEMGAAGPDPNQGRPAS